jgi:hypothetical protein
MVLEQELEEKEIFIGIALRKWKHRTWLKCLVFPRSYYQYSIIYDCGLFHPFPLRFVGDMSRHTYGDLNVSMMNANILMHLLLSF